MYRTDVKVEGNSMTYVHELQFLHAYDVRSRPSLEFGTPKCAHKSG